MKTGRYLLIVFAPFPGWITAAEPDMYTPGDYDITDRAQITISENINRAAQWIDSFFDDERFVAEDATTKLRLGESVFLEHDESPEYKTKVSLSIDIPKTKKRLRVFVASEEDTKPTALVQNALPDLHLHAQRLHDLRRTFSDLRALWYEAKAEFEQENGALAGTLGEVEEELAQAEDLAREAILAHYEVTGAKSLAYGFSVAEYTVHEVGDEDAITYCIAHNLPGALKLNRVAFLKLLNCLSCFTNQ